MVKTRHRSGRAMGDIRRAMDDNPVTDLVFVVLGLIGNGLVKYQ